MLFYNVYYILEDTLECGRFLNYKYFVGEETDFDDFPWLVLLEYDTRKQNFSDDQSSAFGVVAIATKLMWKPAGACCFDRY